MEQIKDNLYAIKIPLPNSPLRATTTYFIKGQPGQRHLLIDTAFNADSCEEVLMKAFAELEVSLADTDIFITHMHVDHCGLISRLKVPSNTIYASEVDKYWIDGFNEADYWQWQRMNNRWAGTPEALSLENHEHVAYTYRPNKKIPLQTVTPGTELSYGGYLLKVVDLAGHTPGQVGLWEEEQSFMFSADHVLNRVSPNIAFWDQEHDYLGAYLSNLAKVKKLPVKKLYSAHFQELEDHGRRIDELIAHHEERLAEIVSLVGASSEAVTAFEIAEKMPWLGGKKVTEIAPQQRWFACTEVLAHLHHLATTGKLKVRQEADTFKFSL